VSQAKIVRISLCCKKKKNSSGSVKYSKFISEKRMEILKVGWKQIGMPVKIGKKRLKRYIQKARS